MKHALPPIFAFTLSALVLVAAFIFAEPISEAVTATESAATDDAPLVAVPAPDSSDAKLRVNVLVKGETLNMTLADYLRGVTASEVPGTFYPEAIKAQAVAARTNLYWKLAHTNPGHPSADVCDDPAHCAAYATDSDLQEKWGGKYAELMPNIVSAVNATDGIVIRYNGDIIQAVFHSSGGGYTEDSGNVWTEQLPYLVTRESPEGPASVPNFISEYAFTINEFKRLATEKYPGISFDKGLLTNEERNAQSGRLLYVNLGDKRVSGTQLRLIYGLRSAMVNWTIDGNEIRLTTKGYGHGVGLSQYGANEFARNGASYEDILTYYYKGSVASSYSS
ncbi:MAG: stage II sporulation protein D [Oscillospiraceae bacterium]|jgi:stage II sporulation protein D|nr:stage II sporulation protein D [Oscillospiraceae bacterium]